MDKNAVAVTSKTKELSTWDPWREFRGFTGLTDLFEDIFGGFGRPRTLAASQAWAPRVDIQETDKDYILTASLPGLHKEDIKVSIEEGVLSIYGEHKSDKEEKGKDWVRREISQGSFCRSFMLPSGMHPEDMKASYKDGLLTLTMRKPEQAKSRGVNVKVD